MFEFKLKVKNYDFNLIVWLKNLNKVVNEIFYGNIIIVFINL